MNEDNDFIRRISNKNISGNIKITSVAHSKEDKKYQKETQSLESQIEKQNYSFGKETFSVLVSLS